MPGTPTTKYALPTLAGTDPISGTDEWAVAAMGAIDPLLAPSDQGVLASRPVSSGGSPGKIGRTYKATDTGQLFRDNGTGWDEIPFVPLSSAKITPASGIQSSSTPQTGIGTSFTDVTSSSFSITPTVAGILLVEGFVVFTNGTTPGLGSLALNVDGADQTYVPTLPKSGAAQLSGALPGLWRVSLTAAAHTIKLRVKCDAGTIDVSHFALKYLLHS